jgi:hypothetical protein
MIKLFYQGKIFNANFVREPTLVEQLSMRVGTWPYQQVSARLQRPQTHSSLFIQLAIAIFDDLNTCQMTTASFLDCASFSG